MKKNTNAFKIFSVLFILVLSAVSVSALSLVTEFDKGMSQKSIMPGQSTNYFVMAVADQSLSKMQVTAKLYDLTTGEKVFLENLFDLTTSDTFFYPGAFTVTPSDYLELPGTYVISVTAEELLTNGVDRKTTSELSLEVIGNRLPVADFIYAPKDPSTITPVKLDSTAYDTDGYIVKWEWFANSVKIGEGKTFTYLFNKQGTYQVTLKVTDNEGGVASATKPIVVSQGEQKIYPIAQFTYTPINPIVNQSVTFTSTSYDTDGSIVKEEWDFNNDGVFETTGHVVNKAFVQSGNYIVTLKVTDNSNLQSSTSKTVVVSNPVPPANVPPVADFTYFPMNITVAQQVVFTSTSYDTDGILVSYEWFVNGVLVSSTGNALSRVFSSPGIYTITLTVTDDDGAQGTKTKQITVNALPPANIPPVADFTYIPNNPMVNDLMIFTSTSYDADGSIVKEEWDFDNNGIFETTGHVISRTFTVAGSYPVTLRVTDNLGAKTTITKVVVVKSAPPVNVAPVADFVYSPMNITVSQQVTFTSTSYDSDGYLVSQNWYIDGVLVGSGNTITKSFSNSGNHTVTLTVTDDDGAKDSETKQIFVNCLPPANIPPYADFVYSPMNNINTLTRVNFSSTSYDVDGTIVLYRWYIDQVLVGNGDTMSTVFSTEGTHSVTLIVTDDDGANNLKTKQIVVKALPPVNVAPVANFVYTPLNPEVSQQVTFTSTSFDTDGSIVKEEWDLNNDGVFETVGHVAAKSFAQPGNYPVTLKVTDNSGATATATKIIAVKSAPPVNIAPVADFTYVPKNITVGQQVTFTSTSHDSDGYLVSQDWYINGVYTGSGISITRIFSSSGFYTITLTVKDDDGASDSASKQIVVYCLPPVNVPPVADFVYASVTPRVGENIKFVSTSYDTDGVIVSYEWFVDGTSVPNAQTNPQLMYHVFSQTGTYTVMLRVTDDDGATDSVSRTIIISDVLCPPNAVLRIPESVTVNTLVKMDGVLSTAGCNATITAYKWQIYKHDALVSEFITSTPYANYTFSSNAEHRVVLTVYNSNMLSDSDEKLVFAGRAKQDIVVGSEDDLFVDYFDVVGTDYGVITCSQSFAISATVSNDRGEDIKNLRVTFAIPELGYKIKSSAFNLNAGKTKTITFYGDLDMMKEDFAPGEYYAFIGASDTDTIRVKYFPLIIK